MQVFVEGLERSPSKRKSRLSWVHIWTVKDSVVVGLREYVNTAVYAAHLKPSLAPLTTIPVVLAAKACAGNLVWESKLWRERDTTTPGLIVTL